MANQDTIESDGENNNNQNIIADVEIPTSARASIAFIQQMLPNFIRYYF